MKLSRLGPVVLGTTLLAAHDLGAQQPAWVAELGTRFTAVPFARVNPKAGIDPTLHPAVEIAVGSDILAQLIFSVDYRSGQLILIDARPR